jgi:SsrA-binding protein
MATKTSRQIAENRKARHEYFVMDTYECGIELVGTEVKSLRAGAVNLKDSYASISRDAQIYVEGMHISPYEKGNIFNHDPLRRRRLLMHKREILKLLGLTQQQGYTLVPLSLYFKDGKVKVALGLCKGKKLYDKRDTAAKRDAARDMERAVKSHSGED